jgi:hypothetical protein
LEGFSAVFRGTEAKRSPGKPDPLPFFHGIGERPTLVFSWQFSVGIGLMHARKTLNADRKVLNKNDIPLKIILS